MTINTTAAIWDIQTLLPEQKLILLAIAELGDVFTFDASQQEYIARLTGYSVAHIQRIFDRLRQRGIIEPSGEGWYQLAVQS